MCYFMTVIAYNNWDQTWDYSCKWQRVRRTPPLGPYMECKSRENTIIEVQIMLLALAFSKNTQNQIYLGEMQTRYNLWTPTVYLVTNLRICLYCDPLRFTVDKDNTQIDGNAQDGLFCVLSPIGTSNMPQVAKIIQEIPAA